MLMNEREKKPCYEGGPGGAAAGVQGQSGQGGQGRAGAGPRLHAELRANLGVRLHLLECSPGRRGGGT